MIKILIDNEEVVSDSTLQIKEEMLSTSSTILKNCYPKAWEDTKDYNSNYYFPKDYSKCKIIQEEEIDFEILGETTQEGTPTPDSPKPIINKTGTITETIGGLPYQFNLGDIELCKIGNYQDRIKKSTGKNLFDENYTGITSDLTYKSIYVGDGTFILSTTAPMNTNGGANLFFLSGSVSSGASTGTNGVYTNRPIQKQSENGYVTIAYRNTLGVNPENYVTQLEKGTQATSYEPYGKVWYVEKQIGKVVLDGSETYEVAGTNTSGKYKIRYTGVVNLIKRPANAGTIGDIISNQFIPLSANYTYRCNQGISVEISGKISFYDETLTQTTSAFKTWLESNNMTIYYALNIPTYEQITDPTLLEQLNNVGEILVFCGCVKNTGNISLNPRDPHYVDLQILDFKTLLSEGETLNYVITDKTITEAINQVVASISDYGFVVGNIELLTPNDKINAYSTLNKTAYDVFQYIADITQSKWTTRMVDENTIAIDFYDPTLMPQASPIESTQSYFEQNDIEDISFNYSTNDYRNKQIMTSDEVFANITQTETLIADGYRDSFMCQNKIGIIEKITVNGVEKTFATKSEEELGVSADFIYQPGEMTFNANTTYSAGAVIVITYYAIVKGREIILNTTESTRVSNQIGRKGTISRYENRNDTTSSQELIKIGQSYIKYKGSAEITLKVISGKDLFDVGQIVNYDAPLEELSTDYMVKSKVIDMYLNAGEIFYTYELSSNFNSENAINYFDNQRAKNQGNIGEGETITRNIDLESTALIQFYDTNVEEIVVSNPTSLDFGLDGVLI